MKSAVEKSALMSLSRNHDLFFKQKSSNLEKSIFFPLSTSIDCKFKNKTKHYSPDEGDVADFEILLH